MRTCKGLTILSVLVLISGSALTHRNTQILGPRIAVRFQKALNGNEEAVIRSKLHDVTAFTELAQYSNPYFASWKLTQFKAGIDLESALQQLRALPQVAKVEVIGTAELASIEIPSQMVASSNDPLVGYQWGLSNQGQILRKDIDDIHSITVTGIPHVDIGAQDSTHLQFQRPITVAVIDSGVDLDHVDLEKQILVNKDDCEADGRLPALNSSDKDANGFAGDCKGWNFTSTTNEKGDNRPYDDVGHGTHIAGIISAQTDNAIGVRGFNNQIKILPIKVLSKNDGSSTNAPAASLTDRITRGILYAVTRKADVINLSMGWPESVDTEFLRESVREAQRHGIIIVAAAGNNGHSNPVYPCAYPGVICVGSYGIDGKISDFSNYGSQVDLLAPGEQILSTFPTKLDPSLFFMPGYELKSGTSQAAAFVSGMIATSLGTQTDLDPNGLLLKLIPLSQQRAQKNLENDRNNRFSDKPTQGGALQIGDLTDKTAVGDSPDFDAKKSDRKLVFTQNQTSRNWSASGTLFLRIPQKLRSSAMPTLSLIGGHLARVQIKDLSFNDSTDPNVGSLRYEILAQNLNFDRAATIKIAFPTLGFETFQDVFMSRVVSPAENIASFAMDASSDYSQKTALRTVQELGVPGANPLYYQALVNPNNVTVKIFGLDSQNSRLILNKTLTFDGALRLSGFTRFNQLPTREPLILIQTLNKNAEGKSQILYHWFNASLEPAFGNKSIWTFLPEVTIPPGPDKITWILKRLRDGTKVPVPHYLSAGKIPAADQSQSLFDPRDKSETPHVYYLDPQESDTGVTLSTRIVDNKGFKEALNKSIPCGPLDVLTPVILAPQSRPSNQQNQGLAIFKIERRSGITYLQTKISANEDGVLTTVHQAMPQEWNLSLSDSDTIMTVANESTQDLRSGFASILSSQNGTLLRSYYFQLAPDGWLKGITRCVFHNQTANDPVLGTLGAFDRSSSLSLELATKYKMLSVNPDGSAKARDLLRYSFLPGTLFQESFYPVLAPKEDNSSAVYALYQDLTQVTGDGISLLTFSDNGEPTAEVKNTLNIPKNCVALNPALLNQRSHFVLLCTLSPTQSVLKFVPMNLETTASVEAALTNPEGTN